MSDVGPRLRRALACHAVCLLALAGGCAKDPSDVIERVAQSVESWSSCVRLTGRQRAADEVPEVYFKQLLEAANQGLDEQERSLSHVPPADPRRQALERRIGEVRKAVREQSETQAPSARTNVERSRNDGDRAG